MSNKKQQPVSHGPEDVVRWAFWFYFPMLFGSMACSWVVFGKLHLWPGSAVMLLRAVIMGAALGGLVVSVSRILVRYERWRNLFKAIGRILGPLSRKDVLVLAILSGFGEEALFRGLLQPWLGIVPASVFFAVLHFGSSDESSSFSLWPWFALFAGFALGWMTEITETWASAAIAHTIVNYMNLTYVCCGELEEDEQNDAVKDSVTE